MKHVFINHHKQLYFVLLHIVLFYIKSIQYLNKMVLSRNCYNLSYQKLSWYLAHTVIIFKVSKHAVPHCKESFALHFTPFLITHKLVPCFDDQFALLFVLNWRSAVKLLRTFCAYDFHWLPCKVISGNDFNEKSY